MSHYMVRKERLRAAVNADRMSQVQHACQGEHYTSKTTNTSSTKFTWHFESAPLYVLA